jgi:hypothetical protein
MTIADLQHLITTDALEKAVDALLQIGPQTGNTELHNQIILQAGKFNSLKSEIAQGVLTKKEEDIKRNRIRAALLYVVGELPRQPYVVSSSEPAFKTIPPIEKPETGGNQQNEYKSADQPGNIITYAILITLALASGLAVFIWSHQTGVFNSGSGNLARFVVLLILGISSAFALFGVLRSTALYQGRVYNGTLQFGGPVVVFLSVILLGYTLTTQKGTLDITIEVLAPEGHLQYLGNYGVVTLELPTGPIDKTIDKDGRVIFPGISADMESRKVKIRFRQTNQPYRPQFPDSNYTLSRENRVIQLAVTLDHLDKIEGFVADFSDPNRRLPGVTIRVRHVTTATDSTGHFILHLPASIQAKYQTIEASKAGYAIWRQDSIPVHPQQEIPIQLKKLPKQIK